MPQGSSRRQVLATLGLALCSSAGCTDVIGGGSDARSVEVPDRTRIGDPLELSFTGGSAGATVPLEITTTVGANRTYRASRSVTLTEDGTARLQVPSLAERSIPGMALWPLQPDDSAVPPFTTPDVSTVTCSISAGDDWPDVETTRVLADDGVERTDVTDPVNGRLYTRDSGSGPGVIVLHGSRGAVASLDRFCRMLCTRGHTVLALRYFGDSVPDLPDTLRRVPLEYFERAIAWMRERPNVDDVGLVGISRGGEAVLLVGATLEFEGPVISYAGSGIVTPGWPDTEEPAWTYGGEPVANPSDYAALRERYGDGKQLFTELDPDELPHLDPPLAIPIERIRGPVCLFSGTDDPIWPSPTLLAVAERRLERTGHDHRFEHQPFEDAGHAFMVPYHPKAGGSGGSATANYFASATSFATSVSFLES